MKKRYSLILIFLLTSCIPKNTISQNEITLNKNKFNKEILNQFPNTLKKPLSYTNEIKKISSIVNKIDKIYYKYSNKNKTKIRFVEESPNPNIQELITALPDDTILVTQKFLDLISAVPLSDNELSAIMCHESAHIFNNDWSNKFRKNYSTIRYNTFLKVTPPNVLGIGLYAGWKKLFSNENVNIKQKLNQSTENVDMSIKKEDIIDKGSLASLNKLSIQDFNLNIEIGADKEALECLKTLNINPKYMRIFLKKSIHNNYLQNLFNVDDVKQRILKLKDEL